MNTSISSSLAKHIAFRFFEKYYNTITSEEEYENVLDFYAPDATFSRYGLNPSETSEFKGLEVRHIFYKYN